LLDVFDGFITGAMFRFLRHDTLFFEYSNKMNKTLNRGFHGNSEKNQNQPESINTVTGFEEKQNSVKTKQHKRAFYNSTSTNNRTLRRPDL
jgi:hypothetical protein